MQIICCDFEHCYKERKFYKKIKFMLQLLAKYSSRISGQSSRKMYSFSQVSFTDCGKFLHRTRNCLPSVVVPSLCVTDLFLSPKILCTAYLWCE